MGITRLLFVVLAVAATVTVRHAASAQTPSGRTTAAESDQARAHRLGQEFLALRRAGKYTEGLSVGAALVEAAKAAFGTDSPNFAVSLAALASIYRDTYQYAKAEPLYQQALEINRKALGENHPDYAACLDNLAGVYRDRGEYIKAEPLFRQALEIHCRTLGQNHPTYVRRVNDLAALYLLMGDYAKAEPLFQKALAIWRQVLGENHPDYATGLTNLACLYKAREEYVKAEPLYQQALQITRRTAGENHPSYANRLHNLAGLYAAMGEYTAAEHGYQKALEIKTRILGENDPSCAASLNNLAELYRSVGEYAKAEPLYHKMLAIWKQVLGENHPDYAVGLNNLGCLYTSMEQYAKAKPLHQQALEIRKTALGEHHPDYAVSLNNLASVHMDLGEYAEAELRYRQALQIEKQTLGEGHLTYAKTLANLGLLYAAWGHPERAWPCFVAHMDTLHGHTTRVLMGLPERRQLAYVQQVRHNVEGFLSFILQHMQLKEAVRYGAEWLVRWKALVAEVQTEEQRLLRQTRNPRLRDWIGQLTTARQELAQLTLSPPPQWKPHEIQQRRDAAETRVAVLESKLAQESSQFAEYYRLGQARLGEVAAALPVGSVLLDYAKIQDFDFKATGTDRCWGDWRYVLFVTAAGETPQPALVDLGPARPIEEAIAACRRVMGQAEQGQRLKDDREIRVPLLALRKLVIDPALAHLRGKQHWIICPDGQLALVPFEALPVDGGKYLIELKKLGYLGAGREAVAYAGSRSRTTALHPALLVGDPDFNLSPDAQLAELRRLELAEDSLPTRGVGGSRERHQVLFAPLPATRAEVDAAARLVGGRKLLQQQALEGAVKQVLAPEILYLATHGFFLAEQPSPRPDDGGAALSPPMFAARRGVPGGGREPSLVSPSDPLIENPLLRCGLALAGANRRDLVPARGGGDDGILTGMEVAGLDLWGTQLVVLSACQTGLGDVQLGEGVMGLRRAFLLAGARRVLATLWMVPDQETQALMTDVMTRWKAGTPAVDALRDAQIAMIAQLRKQQSGAHPIYWAAFTLTGDWR